MKKSSLALQQGFTLIEFVVVIGLLAIFMGVVVPNVFQYLESGKKTTAIQTLRAFENGITLYNAQVGKFPARLAELTKNTDESAKKRWQGPYLKNKEIPTDPWGNKYQYQVTPQGAHPYELYSYGSSGKGSNKEEWISVWDEN